MTPLRVPDAGSSRFLQNCESQGGSFVLAAIVLRNDASTVEYATPCDARLQPACEG